MCPASYFQPDLLNSWSEMIIMLKDLSSTDDIKRWSLIYFFYRKNVNNKLYKHNRGTIDLESFDSYKCVHIFIFISNFHSIITRMGLYHAINLSCAAYVKKYIISKNHFHFWIFSTSECHGSCRSMFPWQQPLTAWVHAGVL